MQTNELRRRRRKHLFIITLCLPVALIAGFLSNLVGSYYYHRNLFNLAAEANDRIKIEQELVALDYYHNIASKLGLRRFADEYLYHDAYIDRAIQAYLINDYDMVINNEELLTNYDNHLVHQLIGSSRFRQAKALYAVAESDEDKAKIIEMINTEVSQNFRTALELGPGPDLYFDHTFNYDLTIDADLTKLALESPALPRQRLKYEPRPGEGEDENEEETPVLNPIEPGGGSPSKKVG